MNQKTGQGRVGLRVFTALVPLPPSCGPHRDKHLPPAAKWDNALPASRTGLSLLGATHVLPANQTSSVVPLCCLGPNKNFLLLQG